MTLQQFTNSPVVQMIGYVFGILGVGLAIFFYIKQKIRKELTYFTKGLQLVSPRLKNVSKIQVLYEASPIEKLNISEITVFNSGNALLTSDDIPSKSPITIVCSDDGHILEVAIEQVSDFANNCLIKDLGNTAELSFDFLRPYQGCKIKVIHTSDVIGLSGMLKDSELKGIPYFTIPNLREIRRNFYLNAVLFLVSLFFVVMRFFWGIAFLVVMGVSGVNTFFDWRRAIRLKRHEPLFKESAL
jgi:hypothetical protein